MKIFLCAILVCRAVEVIYRDVVDLWFYKLEMQSNIKKPYKTIRTKHFRWTFQYAICVHSVLSNDVEIILYYSEKKIY
jgi:hypothetical protein